MAGNDQTDRRKAAGTAAAAAAAVAAGVGGAMLAGSDDDGTDTSRPPTVAVDPFDELIASDAPQAVVVEAATDVAATVPTDAATTTAEPEPVASSPVAEAAVVPPPPSAPAAPAAADSEVVVTAEPQVAANPVAEAPVAANPDDVVPDAVVPDAVAPDAVAPEAVAPEAVAPEAVPVVAAPDPEPIDIPRLIPSDRPQDELDPVLGSPGSVPDPVLAAAGGGGGSDRGGGAGDRRVVQNDPDPVPMPVDPVMPVDVTPLPVEPMPVEPVMPVEPQVLIDPVAVDPPTSDPVVAAPPPVADPPLPTVFPSASGSFTPTPPPPMFFSSFEPVPVPTPTPAPVSVTPPATTPTAPVVNSPADLEGLTGWDKLRAAWAVVNSQPKPPAPLTAEQLADLKAAYEIASTHVGVFGNLGMQNIDLDDKIELWQAIKRLHNDDLREDLQEDLDAGRITQTQFDARLASESLSGGPLPLQSFVSSNSKIEDVADHFGINVAELMVNVTLESNENLTIQQMAAGFTAANLSVGPQGINIIIDGSTVQFTPDGSVLYNSGPEGTFVPIVLHGATAPDLSLDGFGGLFDIDD